MLRGVRSLTDSESEFTMTLANRKLDPSVETVFLMADEQFTHVSSSLLKQITPLAIDQELLRVVPPIMNRELRQESRRRREPLDRTRRESGDRFGLSQP